MNLSEENKRYVLREFLRGVSHLSDKEYQERVWIRGQGPECDDFDESVYYFFDESDLILKNYKDFGITEDQHQLLQKFRQEFETFSDQNYWPPDFIDTPEWAKIMDMAKEVTKAFNYQRKPWSPSA